MRLTVHGPCKLTGEPPSQGDKNAALACMTAGLLGADIELTNLPDVEDVRVQARLLDWAAISVGYCTNYPSRFCTQVRSSLYLLGPSCARWGRASIGWPGGCDLGWRPVDLHRQMLEAAGAEVLAVPDGQPSTPLGLVSARGHLRPFAFDVGGRSVGASVHAMLTAAAIDGESSVMGAPGGATVEALADLLRALGCVVGGTIGRNLVIARPAPWAPVQYTLPDDALARASWELAYGRSPEDLSLEALLQTDRNVLSLLYATAADEPELIFDTVFPLRLARAARLLLEFGADLTIKEGRLEGRLVLSEVKTRPRELHAAEAPVHMPDLRTGWMLLCAALHAKGTTVLEGAEVLDRGYEDWFERLRERGAEIERYEEGTAKTSFDPPSDPENQGLGTRGERLRTEGPRTPSGGERHG